MKPQRGLLILLLFAMFTMTAEADLIYGSIKVGDAPLANHAIKIACASSPHSTTTDERGSYSIKSNTKGRCTLSLTYNGEQLSYTVYSQDKPARYDLVVVRVENKWTLRRK